MITNFSRNPIPVVCASANAGNANFRYELDVKLMDALSGVFESVFSLKGKPAGDGEYVFNVQKLHAFLSPDLPGFNQDQILLGSASKRRWKATIKEWWGETVATERITRETEPKDILMAGLSFLHWPGNAFFADNIETNGQFLTWQPNNKRVTPDQQEYLYYLTTNQAYTILYIHGMVTFTDGTTAIIPSKSIAGATDKLCIVPVGYTQLALADIDPEKVVKKYSIWVNKSADPTALENRSEDRTYILDHQYYKHARYFLYQNSLGGFETLRCTGKFTDKIEVLQQEGQRVLPANYGPNQASYFPYGTRYDYGMEANAGALDAESKRHLIEFLISEHRYEILPEGFVAIRLLKDKEDLVKDYETMPEFEFEYKYAHQNPAYSLLK